MSLDAIIVRLLAFYRRRPLVTGLFYLALLGLAIQGMSLLSIQTSQLDLLPQDIPPVRDARRVERLAGGAGFLVVALRPRSDDPADERIARAVHLRLASRDAEADALIKEANEAYARRSAELEAGLPGLEAAADRLAARLSQSERVRYVRYRRDPAFFEKKALYFWETKDLREALRRIANKREDLIRRADPFYIDLDDSPPYRLDLSDLIARYRQPTPGGEYMISPDRRMALLLVKPAFPLDDIDLARDFLAEARRIADEELAGSDLVAGFTGTYAYYVEAFESLRASLRPALFAAFAGIALVLFVFLRRPGLVIVLLLSLLYAVALTFGLTGVLIGRLNLFTALFGGVLAGLGVDFGIHLIHRYLEEHQQVSAVNQQVSINQDDLLGPLAAAIRTTGKAIVYSAATTAAAFGVLIFTDFAGFRELGIIATVGIFITVLTMFLFTPYLILLAGRLRPGGSSPAPARAGAQDGRSAEERAGSTKVAAAVDSGFLRESFPRLARIVLLASLPLLVSLGYFATRAGFDQDARNMLETGLESVELNIEIDIRFELSGDPLVVISSTLGEARAVRATLERLEQDHRLIDRVVSIFQFVPEPDLQRRNYALLRAFARENEDLNAAPGDLELRRRFGPYLRLLREKPFGVEDLPEEILREFRSLPESDEKAWLTFVYPDRGRMYRTGDLLALEKIVGAFEYRLIPEASLDLLRDDRAGSGGGSSADDDAVSSSSAAAAAADRALLQRVNEASEAALVRRGLQADIARTIVEHRPFADLAAVRALRSTARATGSAVLMARFIGMIQDELDFIMIGTLAGIVFFLFLSFRRPDHILLCLVPLAIGGLATVACLGVFELRVNFFSVAVFPVIIGYGIDNGIFLFHRFLEIGSARLALLRTAPAILAAGLTTLAGWGSLALAAHPGIRSMGALASIGIVCLVLVSLVFFPALLRLVEERIDSKRPSAET